MIFVSMFFLNYHVKYKPKIQFIKCTLQRRVEAKKLKKKKIFSTFVVRNCSRILGFYLLIFKT